MKCGLEIHQQLNTKKLFCDCTGSGSANDGKYKILIYADTNDNEEVDEGEEVTNQRKTHGYDYARPGYVLPRGSVISVRDYFQPGSRPQKKQPVPGLFSVYQAPAACTRHRDHHQM